MRREVNERSIMERSVSPSPTCRRKELSKLLSHPIERALDGVVPVAEPLFAFGSTDLRVPTTIRGPVSDEILLITPEADRETGRVVSDLRNVQISPEDNGLAVSLLGSRAGETRGFPEERLDALDRLFLTGVLALETPDG